MPADDRSTERFGFCAPFPVTIERIAGVPVHIELGANEHLEFSHTHVFNAGDQSIRPVVTLQWSEGGAHFAARTK